jgi:hypothetical protein
MWGWSFESAFANTELNADYWIIKADGRSIGGSNSPPLLPSTCGDSTVSGQYLISRRL